MNSKQTCEVYLKSTEKPANIIFSYFNISGLIKLLNLPHNNLSFIRIFLKHQPRTTVLEIKEEKETCLTWFLPLNVLHKPLQISLFPYLHHRQALPCKLHNFIIILNNPHFTMNQENHRAK